MLFVIAVVFTFVALAAILNALEERALNAIVLDEPEPSQSV